jgi:catechol-2,3-dioxygenase
MPEFPAVHHVAVTVSDLDRSRDWYNALFAKEPVMDEDTGPFHHVVWLLGGTLLGIHKHSSASSNDPMDETRPGLDHVGFAVESRAQLEEWQQYLESKSISHGGIVDAPYGSGLSFRDPDNNALEFFAPPG